MTDHTIPISATAGDDTDGLLQPRLNTRELRNSAELEDIDRAYNEHIFQRKRWPVNGSWFTETRIRAIHRDMFGGIWAWAGKYRQVPLNLGIPWHQIPQHIGGLVHDVAFWIQQGNMPPLEIAARLQNRLAFIHPFKNGNGRHARLMSDMFLRSKKHPLPVWPQVQMMEEGNAIRKGYIDAMKKADQGDITPLVCFFDRCLPKSPAK